MGAVLPQDYNHLFPVKYVTGCYPVGCCHLDQDKMLISQFNTGNQSRGSYIRPAIAIKKLYHFFKNDRRFLSLPKVFCASEIEKNMDSLMGVIFDFLNLISAPCYFFPCNIQVHGLGCDKPYVIKVMDLSWFRFGLCFSFCYTATYSTMLNRPNPKEEGCRLHCLVPSCINSRQCSVGKISFVIPFVLQANSLISPPPAAYVSVCECIPSPLLSICQGVH